MKKTWMLIAPSGALAAQAHASGDHHGSHAGPVLRTGTMPLGYPNDPDQFDRAIGIAMLGGSDQAMAFDLETLEVATGKTIRFVPTNEGSRTYDFVTANAGEIVDHRDEMRGVKGMPHETNYAARVEPGSSRALVWTFANMGAFEFACLIPGHYGAGMHGRLTVN